MAQIGFEAGLVQVMSCFMNNAQHWLPLLVMLFA